MLKAENIYFSYGNKQVLKNINISLKRNEVIFIGGPNGAGKSTLLRILAGALRGKGRIEMCGKVVQDDKVFVPIEKRCIVYIPQKADILPHKTVEENLRFAGGIEADLDLLKMFGVKEFGVKASKLSGGQRKRLSLVMALVSKRQILLLDEPLSAVDPQSRSGLLDIVIQELRRRGKAAIWVSHFHEVLESGYGKRYELVDGELRGHEEML